MPNRTDNVRFSEQNQEISPEPSLNIVRSLTMAEEDREGMSPEAEEQLRQLKTTLQNTVQSKRMEMHSFEPVSLPGSQPVSRVSTQAEQVAQSSSELVHDTDLPYTGPVGHPHSTMEDASRICSTLTTTLSTPLHCPLPSSDSRSHRLA